MNSMYIYIYIFNEFLILVFRVLFGNVLGLVKEKAHMWLSVVSVWPLVFYFGRNIPAQVIVDQCIFGVYSKS